METVEVGLAEVVPLVGAWVGASVVGASVVVNGHQVVYSVTTSLTVTVAVETKAGETDSEQASSSQWVTVTKVVEFWETVTVELEAAEATAATAATVATVENCISDLVIKRVTEDMYICDVRRKKKKKEKEQMDQRKESGWHLLYTFFCVASNDPPARANHKKFFFFFVFACS